MKTEVLSEKSNPFLKRKEIVVEIENPEEATPSKAAVQQLLAKTLSKDAECVEIIDIFQGKGVSKAKARINLWDEKKVKDLSKKEEQKEGEAGTETAGTPA